MLFTDKTDIDAIVSLHEQGCIRNPITGKTVMMQYNHAGKYIAVVSFLSFDDIKEALQDEEQGFFDYIGQSKSEVLETLDNNFLSWAIQSMNSYDGVFIDYYV